MSDVRGRCSACHKAGPKGFSRNFLCGECVNPDFVSTYCANCKFRAIFREQDAKEAFAPVIRTGNLKKGAVAVLPYCSACQHDFKGPAEHGILIFQSDGIIKEKTVPM